MKLLTEKKANAVYDILVQECSAPESDRADFVRHQTTEEVTEWRFCGSLGFGGKFWNNCGRIYVTCYSEDETPSRRLVIDKANERLMKL
jgi:hypothetical protein